MDSSILQPHELKKDMLVTAVKGKKFERIEGGVLSTTTVETTDTSYCGKVMIIKAIDLPYIVMEMPEANYDRKTTLNAEDWPLRLVTEEFAEAKGVNTEDKITRFN